MKWVLNIIGVLLVLTGGVWFLQGLNILLGSFMSGQPRYIWLGLLAAVIGVGMILYANRRARMGR